MGCRKLKLNNFFRVITSESSPQNGFRFVGDDRAESVFTCENRSYKSIEEGFNTYNLQNRLATAQITRMESDPLGGPSKLVEITSSYLYNQSGIRVASNTTTTIDGGAPEVKNTVYLTDPANFTGYAQVLEESVNGNLTKSYTLGDDVLSQTTIHNSSFIIHNLLYDGHGSTRLLTSDTSTITARYNYDAYGKNLFTANVTTPSATDMLYSGGQFDPNLQMQYLRARYYDQSNGRFNRLDPFAGNNYDPQSLHKYAYTHCNPVMGIDPSGEIMLLDLLASTSIRTLLRTIKGVHTALTRTRLLRAMWKAYEYGSLVIGLSEIGLKLSMGIPLEWTDWVTAFGAISYFKVFVPLVGFMKARFLKNLIRAASMALPKARLQTEFTKWFKMPFKALDSFDDLYEWVDNNKRLFGLKAVVIERINKGRILGTYDPETKIIRLYKGGHNVGTLIRELAHHLNFMKHFKGNISSWNDVIKAGDTLYLEAFAEVVEAVFK